MLLQPNPAAQPKLSDIFDGCGHKWQKHFAYEGKLGALPARLRGQLSKRVIFNLYFGNLSKLKTNDRKSKK